MISITRDLRKDLEKTVKQARRVAEAGARQAVQQLRVGDGDAPKDLTTDERALRTRLRAHGRQLGDRRDAKTGAQETGRLVQECAYEHWHRMLFARFLAETDVLIEPESGVAITLDEVRELAREKATDWLELASVYAERMLPQIFRKDDPALDIALPPETRSEMEDLLKGLSKQVFDADDSLGWVYQFWQADKKDEVNSSGTKIGADELPAVTQLFTEDYMVLFLLHNTLGAWWAGKVLAGDEDLASSAPDEAALRAACKVGDIDWTYLRFVHEKAEDGREGRWRPAAGAFDDWPKAAKDLTLLDPCMGSGHFLVFVLPILIAFRMAQEGLSPSAAVDAVLNDNLFGLEIDPRCTQIAAFNLALSAWRKVGYRQLPRLNLACSGLAIGVTKAEWLKLAEKAVTAADPAARRDLLGGEQNLLTVGLEERAKNGLEALYELFAKAPWLGSLIDPRHSAGDILRAGFDTLEPLLAAILATAETDDTREMAVAAQGMAKAAEILQTKFTLVVTNVPFLLLKKQHDHIRDFSLDYAADARMDLATVFIDRCRAYCESGGAAAIVSPQNWLFLGSYREFRKTILSKSQFNVLVRLGPKAFQTPMWDFNLQLAVITNKPLGRSNTFSMTDCSEIRDPTQKSEFLKDGELVLSNQKNQITNPDYRIVLGDLGTEKLLSDFADSFAGIQNGDSPRFQRYFWEVSEFSDEWQFLQATVSETTEYGGRELVLRFDKKEGHLREEAWIRREKLHDSDQRGNRAWGKIGVAVSQMGSLPVSVYTGELLDQTCAVILPKKPSDFPAIWKFCASSDFSESVRRIDQKLNVTNSTLVKVPFDIERWRTLAAQKKLTELPKGQVSDPTNWLFDGNPVGSTHQLGVGAARLVGYRWPRQAGYDFINFPAVPENQLRQDTDTDGIVCLTALKGEPPAEQRLNALLADAFGADWSAAKLAGLLSEAGYAGKSLDDWLRDGFFAQHCDTFGQRPFIWHIWDGRRDGFHALVNYQRLSAPNGAGRRTLEKLIYSYLGDWIDRLRSEQKAGLEAADGRLAHAEHLKAMLIAILKGEPPFDIFVRWKPLHKQPLGWEPDVDDGVRVNLRPFMAARPLGARGANACILRTTPKNVKWDKDRGKESVRDKTDYPWLWTWDGTTQDFVGSEDFDGNRWNDLHYSTAAKQTARDLYRASAGGKI